MTAMESILATAYNDELSKTASLKKVAVAEAKKVSSALTKCASMPYTPKAYEAVCEIMKIAGSTVDTLVAEIDGLKKIAEVRAVLDDMIEHGMISKSEVMEKAAALLKKTDRELEITKEAISMTKSANMSGLFESGSGFNSTESSASGPKGQRSIFGSVLN